MFLAIKGQAKCARTPIPRGAWDSLGKEDIRFVYVTTQGPAHALGTKSEANRCKYGAVSQFTPENSDRFQYFWNEIRDKKA